MKPDITTVRIEKRQNRAQILAFAFQESLEEGLFCRSPVVNEVVLRQRVPGRRVRGGKRLDGEEVGSKTSQAMPSKRLPILSNDALERPLISLKPRNNF